MCPTLIFPAYSRYYENESFTDSIFNVTYSLDGRLEEETLRTIICEFSGAATQLQPMQVSDDSAEDDDEDKDFDENRYLVLMPQSIKTNMFNLDTLKFSWSAKLDLLRCPDSFKTGKRNINVVNRIFKKEFDTLSKQLVKINGSTGSYTFILFHKSIILFLVVYYVED